nr:HlyD family efflux transporter periplasmic adaptor subunit [Rhizobium leguminosarum]
MAAWRNNVADKAEKQAAASREIDEKEQQLIKAAKQLESMTIKSPIKGIVQTSAITTVGQVVTAGAELMRIVPDDASLEIEAYLPNKDFGFVSPGQPAVIKIEAFPFTRYGIINGNPAVQDKVKIGILLGSAISGVAGSAVLMASRRKSSRS